MDKKKKKITNNYKATLWLFQQTHGSVNVTIKSMIGW